MKKWFWMHLFTCFLAIQSAAISIPPAPLQNYFPMVIVNNSMTVNSDNIYLILFGKDPNGVPAFLVPNANGVCQYVYPTPSGQPSSASQSVTLTQLPTASGTGLSNAFVVYMPINISGRGYLSINSPLYLKTAGGGNGNLSISSTSVSSLADPNFYTLYQDFEFSTVIKPTDSSTEYVLDLTSVDFFCLPMELYAASYPSNSTIISTGAGTTPTVEPSGYCAGSTRETIISSASTALSVYPSTWGTLPIAFFNNPYNPPSATPDFTLRIIAAKNSITFGTNGLQFQGAKYPQNYFPQNYVSNAATGPSGISFLQTVYNYYTNPANPLYCEIFPQGEPVTVYKVTSMGTMDPNYTLVLTPISGAGAPALTLALAQLTTEQLLSGSNDWPFSATGSVYTAELSKLFSGLFAIGQLPLTATTTSSGTPFINSTAGFTGLLSSVPYFTNPYSGSGPWYNVYEQPLHLSEINPLNGPTQTNPPFTCASSTTPLGRGYAYDFDDLLGMDGTISNLPFQDAFGNPSQVPGQSQPYFVVTLENLTGSNIPNINNDTYSFPVTIGAAAGGVGVEFFYYLSSMGAQQMTTAPVSGTTSLGTVYVDATHPFQVQFTFNSVNYTYNINLLRQVVIPSALTASYSAIDAAFQGGITFSVSGGISPSFTINFNSSPPPWPGG